jgi:hypothetical protein
MLVETYVYEADWVSLVDGLGPIESGGTAAAIGNLVLSGTASVSTGGGNLGVGPLGTTPLGA